LLLSLGPGIRRDDVITKNLVLPDKPANGFRHYDRAILDRIIFIKKAQGLGFSLNEVKNLLFLSKGQCSEIQALAEAKLGVVQLKIEDLQRLETVLADLVKQCNAKVDRADCPIVEVLLPGRKNIIFP